MKPQYIRINEYGSKFYFSNTEMTILHREDGPAVEWKDGTKKWYINNKLHREDGPAIEWKNGDKSWYRNGELHRDGGPACEYKDGSKRWYRNGYSHRDNGPAIEFPDGSRWWYIDGISFTEAEFKARKASHNGKKVVVDGIEYTLKA